MVTQMSHKGASQGCPLRACLLHRLSANANTRWIHSTAHKARFKCLHCLKLFTKAVTLHGGFNLSPCGSDEHNMTPLVGERERLIGFHLSVYWF